MGKLGQKIEHIDNATNEIMDKIRDYFWHEHSMDLEDYFPNFMATPNEVQRSADDEIYSIIHNQLKKII
tara:strand:+ start:33141 stop:33347 length:207 start_codon:yes stop_codon:yes gene_type:complete